MKANSFSAELEDYERFATLGVCIEVGGRKYKQSVSVCRLARDDLVHEAMALAMEDLADWIRRIAKKHSADRKALLCA
jgi:hypothetical protein